MPTGLMATYDLNVGIKLDVEDLIHVISPYDVPLLGTYGADGRSTLSSDTCFEKKVEWLDEELLTPRTTLAATAVTADTFIVVAAGQRERFQTGDIVVIDAETVRVTGYGVTADSLTVTRAFAGSAAQHSSGASTVGVGSALPEGSDPPAARARDRVNRFNVTEIFGPYKVHVSGTNNVVQKYGLPMNEFDYQVANRTKESYVAVEQALIYGQRVEDTSNEWRSMGGLTFYITTNVDSTTTDITDTALLNQLETIFNAGGNPDRFVVGPRQKRKVSQFDSSNIRYMQNTDVRGRVVEWYESDFGLISLHLNRWVRLSDGFIFNRDQATITTLRPQMFEMLAKTGDAMQGQILCEKTLRFRREQHAARFSALAA